MKIMFPFFCVCIVNSLSMGFTLAANKKQKDLATVLLYYCIVSHIAITIFSMLMVYCMFS